LSGGDGSGGDAIVYPLNIVAGLTDIDGSETLGSITITGVPAGATLAVGTDSGLTLSGGVVTGSGDGGRFTTADLAALAAGAVTITVGNEVTSDFSLAISVTSTEADGGSTATRTMVIDVPVGGIDEPPTVTVSPVVGDEDTAIALAIEVTGSSTFDPLGSLTIDGIPAGATLAVGTDSGLVLTGNVLTGSGEGGLFTADDLIALAAGAVTVTPAADSDADFSVSVIAETIGGIVAEAVTAAVTVNAVADAPVITVEVGEPTVLGGEGVAPVHYWNFESKRDDDYFDDQVGDADGREFSRVEINTGGRFGNAGEFDPSGHHDADDALKIPHESSMELASGTVTVWFRSVDVDERQGVLSKDADHKNDGDLTMYVDDGQVKVRLETDGSRYEVKGGQLSNNTWHQATFTWGAAGMKLFVDGQLVDTDAFTGGLANNQNPLFIGASANDAEGDFGHDDLEKFFRGRIDDVAIYGHALSVDEVQSLYANGVQALMDESASAGIIYPLDITVGLTDTDGSETLGNITISGVPQGAALSAGTDNGGGVWTVGNDQLAGLSLTVSNEVSADFTLSVSATSLEGENGSTATTAVTVPFNNIVNDAPILEGDGTATVGEDGTATLTAADLHLFDQESSAAELVYRLIDDVDFGRLYLDDGFGNKADLEVGATFTQADIDMGLLSYEQDDSLSHFWGPETPEWSAGGAPVDQANLTMPLEAEGVTVTFQGEEAGYHNVMGWYKLDVDGNPTEPQIIWRDTSEPGEGGDLAQGTTATLDGLAPGQSFGFFIIQDGANKYNWLDGQLTSNNTLEFSEDGGLRFINNADHTVHSVGADDLFFTDPSLNPDGINHALSGVQGDELMIGFEDLTGGGDNDFDDVTFSVKYEGVSGPQTATHDSFTFTAEDGGGATVADQPDPGQGYTVTDGQATFDITLDQQPS